MVDGDSDSDAEMADYGTRTDFSDDVDPNFDAKACPQQGSTVEIAAGKSIPRFPGFGGISRLERDSRLAGNRETGKSHFYSAAARDRPGESGPGSRRGRRAGPGAFLVWSPSGSAGGVFSRCMGASAVRKCGRQCAQGRWKVPMLARPRGPRCGLGGQPHASLYGSGRAAAGTSGMPRAARVGWFQR